MEFGAEFEDDFFEQPQEKKVKEIPEFHPKVYVPLWFMDPKLKDGGAFDTLKHQADFYYYSKNYPKAVEAFEKCLELVPPLNSTTKREFMENISRSLLHMDEAEKALTWSLKLHASSINSDQKVVSMNLLATVCHKLGKYKEELEALHCCIEAHKCCPEFWMRLGHCYAGLFNINLPGCSINNSQSEHEPCCAFNSKIPTSHFSSETNISQISTVEALECGVASTSASTPTVTAESVTELDCSNETVCEGGTVKCEMCILGIQIVSTCLIQTRILIDTSGSNMLGAERDRRIKDMVTASIKHMEVHQSFIDEASKVLGPQFLAGLQDSSSNLLNTAGTDKKEVEKEDL